MQTCKLNYAAIRGVRAQFSNAVLFLTPIAIGFVFDQTGFYRNSLLVGAAVMLIAAFTFFQLKPSVKEPALEASRPETN